jgi:hypothetical protein
MHKNMKKKTCILLLLLQKKIIVSVLVYFSFFLLTCVIANACIQFLMGLYQSVVINLRARVDSSHPKFGSHVKTDGDTHTKKRAGKGLLLTSEAF